MNIPTVRVPVPLLFDSMLSPAARLVSMALQLHARGFTPGSESAPETATPAGPARPLGPADPARLASLCGLARATVLRVLPRLAAAGWCTLAPGHLATAIDRTPGEVHVSVPADLVTDPRVGIRAKLLFGILRRLPGFRCLKGPTGPGTRSHFGGQFTYAALSELAGASRNAIKRAVNDLTRWDWLQVEQKNRLAPLVYTLRNPIVEQGEAEVARANARMINADSYGEGLMHELLRVLVNSEDYEDNATPGFMENPLTRKRLELDRFYPPGVAFEYNGPQHYVATGRYTAAEVEEQRIRDVIKHGLCAMNGIRLVVVHTEDLSLAGMRAKVGDLLPLRDRTGHQALIKFLESECRQHQWDAIHGKFSTPLRPVDRSKAAT